MMWNVFWCSVLILMANGMRSIVLSRPDKYSWKWRIFADSLALAEVYWALTFVIHP